MSHVSCFHQPTTGRTTQPRTRWGCLGCRFASRRTKRKKLPPASPASPFRRRRRIDLRLAPEVDARAETKGAAPFVEPERRLPALIAATQYAHTGYDALHRLTRIDQEGQTGGNTVNEKRVDFSYNALGQYTEIARFNGTAGGTGDEIATSTYAYDSLGRLTDLEYENGGVDLFTPYEWSYDDLHRVTQFVSQDGTSDYEYDPTSQLTEADHDYQTDETYSYDKNGNRTMTGYVTGDNNQLEEDGTYSYEYDEEGNRTKRTNDATGDYTEYDWDYRNRLVKVTDKDQYGGTTQVVEYKYDVFNRRISKAVDDTSPFTLTDAAIERYVYDDLNGVASIDGGNVVLDFVDDDGTGSGTMDLERRYLYGNAVDQVLAQENISETTSSADRVYWMLMDNLGTVRDLAANDGTIEEHYEYDSYGNVVSGDTSLTRYLFTSREFDVVVGLQYSRARWLDNATGRWIAEDPMGFLAGDANLSRYVANNPSIRSDPSGLVDPHMHPADDFGPPLKQVHLVVPDHI